MPLISIILPTRNRFTLLDKALESISHQIFKDFEVIVVNDGGENPGWVIEKWQNALNIRLINLEKNHGPSRARNIAIDASSGSYLAFLDDDDIFLPDHLHTGAGLLIKANADLVYNGLLLSAKRLDALPAQWTKEFRTINYDFNKDFLSVGCYFTLGAVICRNFKDTPVRFNTDYIVCEDWDLLLRLCSRHDFRVQHGNKVTLIYHRTGHDSSLCIDSLNSLSVNRKFSGAWLDIVAHNRTNNALVAQYRDYMMQFHNICADALQKKQKLSLFYFEDFMALLYHSFVNKEIIAGLEEKIHNIICMPGVCGAG